MTQIRDSLFVITGAASGIGQSVAIGAARDGAYVLAADVDRVGLDQTATAVQRTGGKVDVVRLNVGDAAQIETFARQVARSFPQHRIILLNNAGVGLSSGTFINNKLDDFEWLLNINLWGVVRMSRAFLPLMQQRPGSHIANVSSVFGFCGSPGTAAYTTAKFAIRGFTNVLRNELAGTGIQVSTVFPGGVRTNIAATSRLDGLRAEAQKAIIAQKFTQRLMTSPEQAAEVILKGILTNKARILIGFDARLIDWITRLLPSRYAPRLLPGIPETFLPGEAQNLKSTSSLTD